ncbi:positive regulator of sigma E, RseC/MucC [Oleiphilus messinensis]|uniref:Positive regulator of sigma E, RseC/MucC n=1 Tax=Oleiphilus messinensis TaxID=141451 RepID=A0A1Y0I4B7_9GAMM|nr:SoxR reducing system RseC family protein [Oleiphilus messinensis]ARU55322.1 positive regulator of sigma E, RseC/MucC [Oleiphilus messinensis]
MIEETGKVVAVDGNSIWVLVARQSSCSTCSAKSTCGQSALSELTQGQQTQLKVRNHLGCQVGDTVTIGIPEQAMLKASALIYLLPIVFMLVFAVCADLAKASEAITAVSGLIGLIAGLGAAHLWSGRLANRQEFEPHLIRQSRVLQTDYQSLS